MREHMILTVTGRDEPGVLKELTRVILDYQGNIEASRMAHLGGDFAVLMLLSVSGTSVQVLRQALEELRPREWEVHTRTTAFDALASGPGAYACGVTVMGADQLGILHPLASFFARQGINVETMSTEVVPAPSSGTPLFAMSAVVTVPEKVSIDELRQALDGLGDQLGLSTAVQVQGVSG